MVLTETDVSETIRENVSAAEIEGECVVREVNVVLLAHRGGSSWSKGRGLFVLTRVPMFESQHAGPAITVTHYQAPQTRQC